MACLGEPPFASKAQQTSNRPSWSLLTCLVQTTKQLFTAGPGARPWWVLCLTAEAQKPSSTQARAVAQNHPWLPQSGVFLPSQPVFPTCRVRV